MTDMATMPIPELVESIREQTKKMGSSEIHIILVLGALANRLEDLHNELDWTQGLVPDAYMAGFKVSGEGWNGEYPYEGEPDKQIWSALCPRYIQWLAEQKKERENEG